MIIGTGANPKLLEALRAVNKPRNEESAMHTEHNARDANHHRGDRRHDVEKRRRVAQMSLKEMRRALLTSEVTGLPNRRAFEEAEPSPVTALSDLDGLKALNRYGYAVGDAILRAKANALREAGLDAYHDKGDEFLCRAENPKELRAQLESARTFLRNASIQVKSADGVWLRVRGADFSYGIGMSVEDAELLLKRHKAERELRGELSRGSLCSISVTTDEAPIQVPILGPQNGSSEITSVTPSAVQK
jgi:GGDEF domain-containing protein